MGFFILLTCAVNYDIRRTFKLRVLLTDRQWINRCIIIPPMCSLHPSILVSHPALTPSCLFFFFSLLLLPFCQNIVSRKADIIGNRNQRVVLQLTVIRILEFVWIPIFTSYPASSSSSSSFHNCRRLTLVSVSSFLSSLSFYCCIIFFLCVLKYDDHDRESYDGNS